MYHKKYQIEFLFKNENYKYVYCIRGEKCHVIDHSTIAILYDTTVLSLFL